MAERTPQEINAEILAALDVAREYEALGVRLAGEVRTSGMVSCYAFGRNDKNPSAWISTESAVYGDSGGKDAAATTQSLWDFAVTAGKFPDWQTARKAYAEKAGVTLSRKKATAVKWRDKLEFQLWSTPGNDILALRWCMKVKPGVTVEAIKAAGGQVAYYPCWIDRKTGEKKRTGNCRQVIALPCYGQWGLAADPVAWVIFDITGQPFDVSPKGHPKTEPRITAKMLSIGPTAGATMGLAGLMTMADPERREAIEWVWKTAGPTDLLRLLAVIPENQAGQHIALTNAGGETSDVAAHQAALLNGKRVAVVGDCDEAGVVGAEKWCRALDGIAAEVRTVRLPWPIEPSHGKDLRDFLNLTLDDIEHDNTMNPGDRLIVLKRCTADPFEMLQALLDSTLAWQSPAPDTGPPAADSATIPESTSKSPPGTPQSPQVSDKDINLFTDRQIAKALQIDVLGRTEAGNIKVYSEHLARTVEFGAVGRLTYEDLLLHFSSPVRKVVSRGTEDVPPGMYPVHTVREALAHLASERLIDEETELGPGCWPATEGQQADAGVVLVNSGGALWYGGLDQVEWITHPRFRDRLLSFEASTRSWYSPDDLTGLLCEAENQRWRSDVVDDLVGLFGHWRWRGNNDPMVVAGLVLATWLQTCWAWRPRIDVLGGSNTGKSMLCMTLAGLFRHCCVMTSDATAAGLRQKIRNSAIAVVVDEVDAKNKAKMARQLEILEMLRSASRGTAALRGTTGKQRGMEFTLRHLVWVAGIAIKYDDQADKNRSVTLNLLPPKPEMVGKLVLSPPEELHALGQRALAAALWAAREATQQAVNLKDHCVAGADSRLVESYSVPAAMLAVVLGFDAKFARDLLADMLRDVTEEAEVEADETSLLTEILSATVSMGQYKKTVGQAIENTQSPIGTCREEWGQILEGVGIKLTADQIVFQYQATKKLLARTRWEGQPIDQYLRRIPGHTLARRRVGGVHGRTIAFDLEWFRATFIGDEDSDSVLPGGF